MVSDESKDPEEKVPPDADEVTDADDQSTTVEETGDPEESEESIDLGSRRSVLGSIAAVGGAGILSTMGGAGAISSMSETAAAQEGDTLTFGGSFSGSTSSGFGLELQSPEKALIGKASDTSGFKFGIIGRSAASKGRGIGGYADATSGTAFGVLGRTASPEGGGVFGFTGPDTGNVKGVLGVTASPDGTGTLGFNNATSGTAEGVRGETSSPSGLGVVGKETNGGTATGLATPAGVRGTTQVDGDQSNEAAPVGVHGKSTGGGVTGGVLGQASGANSLGVTGTAADGDISSLVSLIGSEDFSAGVFGFTDQPNNTTSVTNALGVVGIAADPDDLNQTNVGVYGRSRSDGGYGLYSDSRMFAIDNTDNVGYVARFFDQATEPSDSNGIVDVVTRDTDSDTNVNFVRFLESDGSSTTLQGEIQAASGGGVEINSISADVAEYFPKADPEESFESGTVVGISEGEITRDVADADTVAVVTTAPMLSGGMPQKSEEDDYAKIALLGQVPVDVSEDVEAGDLIVSAPDETGTAVPSDDGDRTAHSVVGVALDDGDAGDQVDVLVGRRDAVVGPSDADDEAEDTEVEQLRDRLEQQAETIDRLEQRLAELEAGEASSPAPADD